MQDFAAIDFETANGKRTSVCSIGVVIVRNGEVTRKFHSLIRPVPNYYSDFTTRIHGITYSDTVQAPRFPEVWVQIARDLHDLPLVAHNSPFDEGCLKAVFEYYGMSYPGYQFFCTYRTAKKLHPGLPNHQLHTVAAHFGYDLVFHHHALADAEACAAIALQIFQ